MGLLGTGGMGEVWLTEPADAPGERVVVKTVLPHLAAQPKFHELFLKEARIAAMAAGPYTVQIRDLGESEGTLFIALEYIDGASLWQLFDVDSHPLPVGTALYIAREISLGLDQLHTPTARKPEIIHRDVSPGNVLLGRDGSVKLTDFGIAKTATRVDPRQATTAGVVMGKLAYMAPEQAQADKVDPRADLYSACVLLFEMLTRELPSRGRNDIDILRFLASGQPVDVSAFGLPADVARILTRGLDSQRTARHPSAAALAEQLSFVLGDGAEAAKQDLQSRVARIANGFEQGPKKTSKSPNRLRWIVTTAALAGAVATGWARPWHAAARMLPPSADPEPTPPVPVQLPIAVPSGDARPQLEAPAPAKPTTSQAPSDRVIRVVTRPSCEVFVAGRRLGASPVNVPVRGRHIELMLASSALGIDQRYDLVPGPTETQRTIEIAHGHLQIRVDPWADVTLDGKLLGQTPLPEPVEVFAGRHQVVLVNAEMGIHRTVSIQVEPGEDKILRAKLP